MSSASSNNDDVSPQQHEEEESMPHMRNKVTTASVLPPDAHNEVVDHQFQESSSSSSSKESHHSPTVTPPGSPHIQVQHQAEPQANPDNAHRMVTRAKAGIMKPNPRYALLAVKGIPETPKTLKEALNHPGWNGAMGEEIDNCEETRTWSVVPCPPNVNVLSMGSQSETECRWHILKVQIQSCC